MKFEYIDLQFFNVINKEQDFKHRCVSLSILLIFYPKMGFNLYEPSSNCNIKYISALKIRRIFGHKGTFAVSGQRPLRFTKNDIIK